MRVVEARGSTPRGTDALMAVTGKELAGTIGGGQLEWLAIAKARELLASNASTASLEIPLGPQIGQCCGGHVQLHILRFDRHQLELIENQIARQRAGQRQVLVFGAGHTGKALAQALAPLPVQVILIDSRLGSMDDIAAGAEARYIAMPETAVRNASSGSAFVVMTHLHDLDFLIIAEALARDDASYCGMIGSATKRAVFVNWLEANGYEKALAGRLVCPIGGSLVQDKRPQVIAALAAAEILTSFYVAGNAETR